MVNYTEDMLTSSIICSGCKKMVFTEDGTKTCEKCRIRGGKVREQIRESVVLCKKDGCNNKRSSDHAYCLKHDICHLIEEVEAKNMRLCANYLRGCRTELDLEHPKKRCEACLAKDREKDQKRRQGAQESNIQVDISEAVVTEKPCTVCCKVLPMEMYQGEKKESITKMCRSCRDICKRNDANRDKEHRNKVAREAERKPERIAVKQAWKEENYEKVAETWQKSRHKRMEKMGLENYLIREAEQQKAWRDKNPDKVTAINKDKKQNLRLQYDVYKRSAGNKNLEFALSLDEFKDIVAKHCYYCGDIQERGFNGIDRIDQRDGYCLTNCVSSCQMCNYIKNTMNTNVFLKRVEHIVTFHGNDPEGRLFPETFGNHVHVQYTSYMHRAKAKKLPFEITRSEFDSLTTQPCYLCGKTSTDSHINGIDRFDNTIGYLYDNCRPCCGECNYMKKNYPYNIWLDKLKQINDKRKHTIQTTKEPETLLDGIIERHDFIMLNPTNKKSREEMVEIANIRKQEKRKQLKEKYSNKEYIKMHANEIAELRRKNKTI